MPELILGLVAVVSTVLLGREYFIKGGQKQQSEEFKESSEGKQSVSSEIVIKAAENLKAQLEALITQKLEQLIKSDETQTTKLIESSEANFKKLEVDFNTQAAQSLQNFNTYLEQLKLASQKSEIANMTGAKERVNQLFENFETKLADFLLQSEQKMMLAVDLELRSARQLIDTYKVQQMNVIDENIAAMLEKTLSLVLAKNLNLKDQMDLVYESLEKAKGEKFIV